VVKPHALGGASYGLNDEEGQRGNEVRQRDTLPRAAAQIPQAPTVSMVLGVSGGLLDLHPQERRAG
jgi:hypothetical protein